jgi:hypothetical protein
MGSVEGAGMPNERFGREAVNVAVGRLLQLRVVGNNSEGGHLHGAVDVSKSHWM